MKRAIFAVVLLITCSNLTPAQIQFGGGVQGGVSIATFPEPVKEFYGMGFGGGLHGKLGLTDVLGIRLNLDYSRFPSDKKKIRDLFVGIPELGDIQVEGLNANFLGVTANAIGSVPTGSAVRPYGLVGVGLHIMNVSDLKVTSRGNPILTAEGDGSETNINLDLGAGMEFLLGKAKLFVEAKYVVIFTSGNNTSYIPFSIGVSL